MRHLYITLLFVLTLACANAQDKTEIDTNLKFNMRYTKCERMWVVLSHRDTDKNYSFGFIYIDSQAGFTYDLKGTFTVDKKNVYHADTSMTRENSIKYRIAPNWRPVALLPPAHLKEMGLSPEPFWIKKYYYNYTDTVAHDYRWGWIYNDVGDSEQALIYLKQAYQVNQHAKGVEFEMAFAYNVLLQFNDAIKVLKPAIQNNPADPLFYKELAYAYSHIKDFDNAIDTYKKGLEHFKDDVQVDARAEMAFNMASIYMQEKNDKEQYKYWMQKARAYAPKNSEFSGRLTQAGF